MISEGKILILQVDIRDTREQREAMKTVCTVVGIDSVEFEERGRIMTVVCGKADPVKIVTKLRRLFPTHVVSITSIVGGEQVKREEDIVGWNTAAFMEEEAAANYPYSHTCYFPRIVEEDPTTCAIL